MIYDTVLTHADEHGVSFPICGVPIHLLSNPTNQSANQKCKEYVRTDLESWNLLKDSTARKMIIPIPHAGESKEFTVTITDEDLEVVLDNNCKI